MQCNRRPAKLKGEIQWDAKKYQEDREDLLGHKSEKITTHYSAAEVENLLEAANRVCDKSKSGTLLHAIVQQHSKRSRESHARHLRVVGEKCNFLIPYPVARHPGNWPRGPIIRDPGINFLRSYGRVT